MIKTMFCEIINEYYKESIFIITVVIILHHLYDLVLYFLIFVMVQIHIVSHVVSDESIKKKLYTPFFSVPPPLNLKNLALYLIV